MNERCKHIGKDGYRCGSYAFNLYKDDIDQGELCDVHYWQERALKAEALAQPEQEPVALPCCGYTDASAVKWNSFNGVVQCHNCGQTYTTPQRTWIGLTGKILISAAQSSLPPDQYEHFVAISEYEPEIYDRLAKAIQFRLKEENT